VARAIARALVKARAVERCDDEPSRLIAQKESNTDQLIHTAVYGKVLRGTLKHDRDDQPPVHLLSFYECESGIVLDQFVINKKNNEESACRAILHPLLVKGRILSADAIFSCRAWCAAVHLYDGYDLLPIKENNPAVLRNLTEFFDDEGIDRGEFAYHKEVNKGHGRLEVREIWTSTQMNDWFAQEWAGIAQVFLIRRTVKAKGKERVEVMYGITNLPRKKASAQRILHLNRKHWGIGATRFRLNALEKRGDGEQGKTLTTDHTMVGVIPIPPGEGGKAAPSLQRLVLNVMKQGEMRKSFDLDKVISATQVPMASASETSLNRRYSERAYAR
jgi:hypothetical protein